MRRQVFWVWALELDAEHAFGVAGADEVGPLLAGWPPRPHAIVAAGRAAELDECGAAIARVQLGILVAVAIDHVGDADAHLLGVGLAPLRIAGLEDRHVAAVAAGALDEAATGGVRLDRRDDLEKIGAEHEQRILQPVGADIGIAITDLDAKDVVHVIDHGLELWRGEADLAKAKIIGHLFCPLFGSFPWSFSFVIAGGANQSRPQGKSWIASLRSQ